MEYNWNYSPSTNNISESDPLLKLAEKISSAKKTSSSLPLSFRKIDADAMKLIWPYLEKEQGRTTDFSYAGILMWVDLFNYEYAIYKDTLFIKGSVESDLSKCAFSLPVGALPLKDAIEVLRQYCTLSAIPLEFSAVPEYAVPEFEKCGSRNTELLEDWGDYLYDAESLASLKGKKMGKKRNHVNKFMTLYPDWHIDELTPENASEAMAFMDIFDTEGDNSEMAVTERRLSRDMITRIAEGDTNLHGAALYAAGKLCAYTIADIKGDTLFIHIEKATRTVEGSYEMINTIFAREMMARFPQIKYINREDDAGDIGLRMAKESYHPLCILRKYNVIF